MLFVFVSRLLVYPHLYELYVTRVRDPRNESRKEIMRPREESHVMFVNFTRRTLAICVRMQRGFLFPRRVSKRTETKRLDTRARPRRKGIFPGEWN